MAFNTGNMTAPMDAEELIELTDEQRDAARLTVCQHATDATDAAELMLILGLYPGQEAKTFKTLLNHPPHLA